LGCFPKRFVRPMSTAPHVAVERRYDSPVSRSATAAVPVSMARMAGRTRRVRTGVPGWCGPDVLLLVYRPAGTTRAHAARSQSSYPLITSG